MTVVQSTLATFALGATFTLASGCGGRVGDTGDASDQDAAVDDDATTDASDDDDGSFSFGDASFDARATRDAAYFDSWGDVQIVDGGGDCEIPRSNCPSTIVHMCCNGTLCNGICALLPGATAPECWCNEVGGCGAGTYCCGDLKACASACMSLGAPCAR